jgi:methanogenic corrinoid protein MtbC1
MREANQVNEEMTVERLFQALTSGDRASTRMIVEETRSAGMSPEDRTQQLFWPTLEMVSSLYRADQMTTLAHHYATRMLRALVDQAQAEYDQKERRERRILMFSGPGEADELAGQLVADLAEADGYEIYFGGGGVANDEILAEVGLRQPHILLMFASAPSDAPNIRAMIDTIRKVDACPELQIAVGGGVFNRAEGLAEEIGADLWAKDPTELLQRLTKQADRRATAQQRTVGRNRRLPKQEAA